MNRTLLSAAVSAALVTLSGGASAIPLTTYAVNADTVEVRISGASAQDTSIEKVLAGLCSTGSLNAGFATNQAVYYCNIVPNAVPNSNFASVAAFTSAFASTTPITKLVVYKSSVGGSGNGANPVANSQAILTFLNLAGIAANPTCLGASSTRGGGLAALPVYTVQVVNIATGAGNTCGALTLTPATQIADAGLSDVEPQLINVSVPDLPKLTRFEGNALTFGILANVKLRNQLQAAQGLTVGSELAAQQPNLEPAQITAILNGTILDFALLTPPGSATPVPSAPVHLAARSSGSGTTRVNNAYFGTDGGQCHAGVKARRTTNSAVTGATVCATLSGGQAAGGIVLQGAGTDDVVQCLANLQLADLAAIGIASTEVSTTLEAPTITAAGTNVVSALSSSASRFVKIAGRLPSLVNVANGYYGLWGSTSFQYRSGVGNTAIGADQKVVADTIVQFLRLPAVLLDINAGITQTWATSVGGFSETGYLLSPSFATPTALPLDQTAILTNPVNGYTKTFGGAQNNCQRGLKF